jgi:hypothetical protein
MKDQVDRSIEIVTHIVDVEVLDKIRSTEPLRLPKREDHKKRKCSDSCVSVEKLWDQTYLCISDDNTVFYFWLSCSGYR